MRKPVGKRLLPPATVGALPLDSTSWLRPTRLSSTLQFNAYGGSTPLDWAVFVGADEVAGTLTGAGGVTKCKPPSQSQH